jgi:hypothetical protein
LNRSGLIPQTVSSNVFPGSLIHVDCNVLIVSEVYSLHSVDMLNPNGFMLKTLSSKGSVFFQYALKQQNIIDILNAQFGFD